MENPYEYITRTVNQAIDEVGKSNVLVGLQTYPNCGLNQEVSYRPRIRERDLNGKRLSLIMTPALLANWKDERKDTYSKPTQIPTVMPGETEITDEQRAIEKYLNEVMFMSAPGYFQNIPKNILVPITDAEKQGLWPGIVICEDIKSRYPTKVIHFNGDNVTRSNDFPPEIIGKPIQGPLEEIIKYWKKG